ncbi:MAG: 4Fe-4S dicluster domain-containing protein [Chloroflexi bacterium]|nr:4Fe-4S dicluster domain-containing protein [Chloroflexota bacterium]
MLHVLRAAIAGGRVTTTYPSMPETAPPAFRGAPTIDPARCDCSAACVDACPAAAISLTPDRGQGRTWQLDLARCVFCGECARACPNEALTMSGAFELATHSRTDLLTVVHHGQSASSRGASEPVAGWQTQPGQSGQENSHGLVGQRGMAAKAERSGQFEDNSGDLGGRLTDRLQRLLRRSLHIRQLDAGSDNATEWELQALLNPVYDVQRLGIDVVASPRHADLLFVTGPVTRNLDAALKTAYAAMPAPRLVVAAGAEACGGGVWQGSYAHAGGVDRVLPVDVYIPGDPPRPQAIVYGLLLTLDRVEQKRSRTEFFR